MLNFVRAVFGSVSVEEQNGKIRVTAVRSKDALSEIYAHWRTSRIEQFMFTKVSPYVLEFYSFFAVEFTYILDQLIQKKGRSAISKSTMKSVKEGMLTNTWLKSTQEEHPPVFNRQRLSLFSKTPLKHQVDFFNHYEEVAPKYHLNGFSLGMGTGTGKAQILSAKIRVPGGWSTMGNISVGDVTVNRLGNPQTVIAVFPQGITEVWRVHFEDGRYTDVNPEHLWEIDNGKVVDTREMKDLILIDPNLSIPLVSGSDLSTEEREEFTALGLLIGRSTYVSGSIEKAKRVQYLVRAVGGIAKLTEGNTNEVDIRFGNDPSMRLKVIRIEERESEPTQCIMVDDAEHLYVTDDFIVTHNTYTSLAASEMLEPDIIIMICPKASLYRVWEDAMQNDYKKVPDYWIKDRDKTLPSTLPKYFIYHLDVMGDLLKDAGRFGGKKVAIIFDESHNLNELNSARTQAAMAICSKIKPIVVFWASATPIKAYGAEAIPMLATFDPFMTKEVQEAFKKLYGKSSTKCFDIIRHRMGNVIFRVDVVKSEPIFTDIPVVIKDSKRFLLSTLKEDMKAYITERVKFWNGMRKEVDKLYLAALDIYEKTIKTKEEKAGFKQYVDYADRIASTTDYAAVKEEMIYCNDFEKHKIEPTLPREMVKDFRSYKSVVKYLPLKVRGECLGNIVSKRREESVVAMIEACNLPKYIDEAKKKTIIFTSYVKAVEDTATYLAGKGYKPVTVYGAGKDDLTSQVKKFFEVKDANPCIATYQSLSTSVPLTVANVILAINAPFRDYILEQAVGRIDRINQDSQTYVFKFFLETNEPNISGRTLDILSWSGDQVNQILGVKEAAVTLEDCGFEWEDNYSAKPIPTRNAVMNW